MRTLPLSKFSGAPSAIERASVATCGSTSYSTLMARTASRACSSVSAATAATSSPWYRSVEPALAIAITALTPGIFSAAEMSIDLTFAYA